MNQMDVTRHEAFSFTCRLITYCVLARALNAHLSSQQDCISLALCERGVLSEFPAARARGSYWFDKMLTHFSLQVQAQGPKFRRNSRRASPVKVLLARRCLARCRRAAAPRAKRAARLLPPHRGPEENHFCRGTLASASNRN